MQFFEAQKKIYARRVWGTYRKIKWAAMIALLGIYYLTPWIRWDRGEHVPDQAVLIDMAGRRGYFFFIEIWPDEVYYLTGILILSAIALFFVTSLFGRVWCGYACPQTVWVDLFMWVERIVQGDRNARMKLDASKLSFDKIYKKSLTHLIWLFIGLMTGGAWVFYFNDAPTLLEHLLHFDVPWSVLSWIIALTLSTYLMAGYAREQVCIYMCPYARFQSAMFDKDTMIIGYDEMRGEKRGKHKQGDSWDNRGHCIDCTACVQVCPMGIDIRDGLQMECIACGLCIDACDNIMDKLNLPRGLVRYDTIHAQQKKKVQNNIWKKMRLIRPRTIYYSLILITISGILLFNLLNRTVVDLTVIHDRNPLFVTLSDGTIRNGYDIKILNKSHEDKSYKLHVEGVEGANIRVQAIDNLDANHLTAYADSIGHFRVFVTAKKQRESRSNIIFAITDNISQNTIHHESIFISDKR